ncbi:MAG: hypothetical protein JWO87_647 [Phycisphaerales bacterium]|jgi:hypothetical protein|nr:hypothetical protein [Phycisphaerales bacterium]
MIRRDLVRLQQTDSDQILQEFTTRQHMTPHRTLGEVLETASQALGFCPQAGETAMGWLQLDAGKAIGRLRRTELIQLSRSIHRFWRQGLAAKGAHPQSV